LNSTTISHKNKKIKGVSDIDNNCNGFQILITIVTKQCGALPHPIVHVDPLLYININYLGEDD